jgi:hypothetical protein
MKLIKEMERKIVHDMVLTDDDKEDKTIEHIHIHSPSQEHLPRI